MNDYNEHDPFAAEWLRALIKAGHLPAGDVDQRSIEDVAPDELTAYNQCHFFAGIGGWPLALRLAGWPEESPVWTGSVPCQLLSSAGKRKGVADQRHLWPAFFWLIWQCRPPVIFGEQVSSKTALKWWDLVADDLAGADYAAAAADLPAASVGAPHKRARLFWVGHTHRSGWQRQRPTQSKRWQRSSIASRPSQSNLVAAPTSQSRRQGKNRGASQGNASIECHCSDGVGERSPASGVGHANGQRQQEQWCQVSVEKKESSAQLSGSGRCVEHPISQRRERPEARSPGDRESSPEKVWTSVARADGPSNHWADCEWLDCRDGKKRPVEPRIRLLADGVPGRVATLRGFGNAIIPQLAAEFVQAYKETLAFD